MKTDWSVRVSWGRARVRQPVSGWFPPRRRERVGPRILSHPLLQEDHLVARCLVWFPEPFGYLSPRLTGCLRPSLIAPYRPLGRARCLVVPSRRYRQRRPSSQFCPDSQKATLDRRNPSVVVSAIRKPTQLGRLALIEQVRRLPSNARIVRHVPTRFARHPPQLARHLSSGQRPTCPSRLGRITIRGRHALQQRNRRSRRNPAAKRLHRRQAAVDEPNRAQQQHLLVRLGNLNRPVAKRVWGSTNWWRECVKRWTRTKMDV